MVRWNNVHLQNSYFVWLSGVDLLWFVCNSAVSDVGLKEQPAQTLGLGTEGESTIKKIQKGQTSSRRCVVVIVQGTCADQEDGLFLVMHIRAASGSWLQRSDCPLD